MADHYDLYISDAVLQELNSGIYPKKTETISPVSTIPLLPLTSDLEQVVEFYIANYVMPSSLVGDAVHLAYGKGVRKRGRSGKGVSGKGVSTLCNERPVRIEC
jgi:hypothetical protein